MKRILIVANQFYQLILAIQMKETLFKDDYVTLLLSNHNNSAEDVYNRLKDIQLFDETVFVKSKGELSNRNTLEKIIEIFQLSVGSKNKFSFYLNEVSELYYDEYISYNLEVDNYALYSILSEYNKKLKYSSYEEGVLSYEDFYYDSKKFKLIRMIRKILRKPAIFDYYDTFYCMYPQLYNGFLNTIKIPTISTQNRELVDVISFIFDVNKNIDYSKYKCIYFESIYETEGRSIGEMDVLLALSDAIGPENILIKKHPRSTVDTYEQLGMSVDVNSQVPFEAIQLCNDLRKCVLIGATSGSLLSVNAIVDTPSKAIMFYPITKYMKDDKLAVFVPHIGEVVAKLKNIGGFDYIMIANSIEEIISEVMDVKNESKI